MAHVCYYTKAQAEASDIGKQNKSVRVSIGKAEGSIYGPKAVILFGFIFAVADLVINRNGQSFKRKVSLWLHYGVALCTIFATLKQLNHKLAAAGITLH